MQGFQKLKQPGPENPNGIQEHDIAKLTQPVNGLDIGTVGTVVYVYKTDPSGCEFEVKGKGVYSVPLNILEKYEVGNG